jgi:hypoxanthine-DNA glycosylase
MFKKALNMRMTHLDHEFAPVFNKSSKILILGSFPSERSREFGFYYSHPQNRFWKLLTYLTKTECIPFTIDDKKQMLLKNRIALWDIIKSCDIRKSRDKSITNAVPVDLSVILDNSDIKQIFTNGGKAYELCEQCSVKAIKLPSTSTANVLYTFEKLVHEWSIIMPYIKAYQK